ncbi:DoxX family protein [Sphingobacterium sp. SYP-B4668]|uniref:DoxX family protein n=1 Tax=Sphingobacterium sp. SYP-B4668 TaxID=2996035 RepID=UPI0022DD257D|nr:DoxX family protein [Sphingobacterium sp. SYP-B4668]
MMNTGIAEPKGSTKTEKILYWVFTAWLALGMLSTGIVQFIGTEEEVASFDHLGYPSYLLIILAIWKILGVMAVLMPRLPLLKEWAYAGFFFVSSGATISHVVLGDGLSDVFPSILLLALTIISWYLRPASRRMKTS